MIYRGLILNPKSSSVCDFFVDGALVVENGKIKDIGDFQKLRNKYKKAQVKNTDGIIVPAFTDIHLHWVQNRVKGSFTGALLPWLKNHIWPEEAKFSEKKYTDKMVEQFYDELDSSGTRNAMIYSSIHKYSTEKALIEGNKHGNFIIGNVLMDQNSPKNLQVSTEEEIKLVEYFAKKYRSKFAITPRFAPTCSMELMKKIAKIAKKYGCFIQTHLSENKDELALVHKLFPAQKNYTDVYFQAGLLGPKTILGHCIHLSDQELKLLAKTKSKVAHCPTSNIALKSGRMPVEKLLKYKISYALATDIGAGPKLDMLDVMRAYLKVHKGHCKNINEVDALYRATLAGAEIMGIAKEHGNLDKGKKAEFNVFRAGENILGPRKNKDCVSVIKFMINNY